MINFEWLIDNSWAVGIIVAWAAALVLVIIYKYEDRKAGKRREDG